MVAAEIIKAVLAGIIVALPVGPILLMVVQRTLVDGRFAGAMTGLGSALGDMAYATVGLLTLTMVQQMIEDYRGEIMMGGGVLLALVGVLMFRRKVPMTAPEIEQKRPYSLWACVLQAFGSVLSNPGALAMMLAVLTVVGLGADSVQTPIPVLVAAVGAGEMLYWLLIVYVLGRFLNITGRTLRRSSRLAALAVCLFAAVVFGRGLWLIIGN